MTNTPATASAQRNVVVRTNSGRGTKNESYAANIMDHRRLVRLIHLAPEASHMDVHQVRLRNELVLPYFLEEHCARKNLILALHHVFEQAKLARQQIDRAVAPLGGPRDQVELGDQHIDTRLRRTADRSGPPQFGGSYRRRSISGDLFRIAVICPDLRQSSPQIRGRLQRRWHFRFRGYLSVSHWTARSLIATAELA